MLIISKLFEYKSWQLYLFILAMTLLILYVSQLRLLNLDVFSNIIGDQLSFEQINDLFEMQLKYKWLSYAILPITLFLKTVFAAFFIHMILIFLNYEIDYSDVFKLNLVTGLVYVLMSFVQTMMLYSIDLETINSTILESNNLSLAYLFEKENILLPVYYLLEMINPFELLYILLMTMGIKYIVKVNFSKSFITVLLIWFSFTTFIIIIKSFAQLTMQ